MVAILSIAVVGIRQVPRAQYERHRTLMLTACGLVVAFVVSYVAKLAFLGREQLELWEPRYVTVLRIHEFCVLLMLLGGGTAIAQAIRLGLPAGASSAASSNSGGEIGAKALERGVRLHRRAGFLAFISAFAGVVTAAYVLVGMLGRA